MKQITVFTPTYNRGYILSQCYESLKRQTCQDFIWQIVDDGSTDNTRELVSNWIQEGKIEIQYIYQENKGMHGAHNTGHKNLKTELCVGCDSDDYLYDDCIEKILSIWNREGSNLYSGVIGMCSDSNGVPLAKIPENLNVTTLYELRYVKKIKGDFKFALRSDLLKKYEYPMYEDENYVAVGYIYFLIDQKYKMLVLHDKLCCQEYLSDGEISNKLKRYVTAPKGYMVYRNAMIPIMHNFKEKYWQATHYVSSAIFAKDKEFIKKSTDKIVVILAIPSGFLLSRYIKYKYRKKEKVL